MLANYFACAISHQVFPACSHRDRARVPARVTGSCTNTRRSINTICEWVSSGRGGPQQKYCMDFLIHSHSFPFVHLFIHRFCTLAYSRPHGCHDGLCSTVLSLPHSITNTKSHLILTVANIYNQMLRLRNASALVSEQWVSASQVQVSIFLSALCWWCSM